jgi:hypothetical protein
MDDQCNVLWMNGNKSPYLIFANLPGDQIRACAQEARKGGRGAGGWEQRAAFYSACARYRYFLAISWSNKPPLAFIGLNPSTATEVQDDPTVRRCKAYAAARGAGGLVMLNLFAYRATNPKDMKSQADPFGRANTPADLASYCRQLGARDIVAAWGSHGGFMDAGRWAGEYIANQPDLNLYALQLCKCGNPGHPLYLKASLRPQRWRPGMIDERFGYAE